MARVVLCVQNMTVPRDPRVWREAVTLAEAGHQVTVLSPSGPHLAARERLAGVDVVRFRALPDRAGAAWLALETANALARTLWHCLRLSLRGRIDVLHAANPPDAAFLVALALRPWGTRFVFDQHDLAPELAAVRWGRRHPLLLGLVRLLERGSYRAADLVVVPNDSYRGVARRRGAADPERVVVVRNGPLRAGRLAAPPPPPPRGPLVVAYAGVMGPQDGVELLLEAVAEVAGRRPGAIRCLLIGDGSDAGRLRRRARALGLEALVEWTGWLDGQAYAERLHGAHCAVSPDPDDEHSRRSTMIKVTEYVAGGLPALVADLPESRVSAGAAALYFRAGDAADLARCLEDLIERPDLLDGLSELAARRGPELLWEHGGERLVAAYRRLLQGADGTAGAGRAA
jgi:glycosyltransferase involved in cell wall biosynthesis